MKKYLFINSVCNGSTGHIVIDETKKLLNEGNECSIAYGRGDEPKGLDVSLYKIDSILSKIIHGILTRVFDLQGFGSKSATKKLINYIESYKPDVIWLHNLHGYYLNVDTLFKYLVKTNAEIRWTLHDCWAFTGHCCFLKCDGWKTGCKCKCIAKKDYPGCLVFSNPSRNYQNKKAIFTSLDSKKLTLISPSKWLAELAKQSYLSKYKVEVKNNTVDCSIFKHVDSNIKERYSLKGKKIILGVASVWEERKGLGDFISLSKILDSKYQIVLIGLNKHQIKNLPSNIVGIQRTENQNELVEWYSAADYFFNPTREDNYPTVLLEAKACGCKSVSYDTGGSGEICDTLVNDYVEFNELLKRDKKGA